MAPRSVASWKPRWWFLLMRGVSLSIVRALMGVQTQGLEKVPRGQGVIICANHNSEIDPLAVAYSFLHRGLFPRMMAKASLFLVPVLGPFLRSIGCIPVDRRGTGSSSLKAAEEVLRQGGILVVYPEGTLTTDPQLWPMAGKGGAVRLALLTGAPIIPVAHWGAHELMPPGERRIRLFPRKHVRVLFGDPVPLNYSQEMTRENLRSGATVVMDSITGLLAQLRHEPPPTRAAQGSQA